MTYTRYSNDMFRYMSKAEFVTLVSLKVPSGKKSGFLLVFSDVFSTSSRPILALSLYYVVGLRYYYYVYLYAEHKFQKKYTAFRYLTILIQLKEACTRRVY